MSLSSQSYTRKAGLNATKLLKDIVLNYVCRLSQLPDGQVLA